MFITKTKINVFKLKKPRIARLFISEYDTIGYLPYFSLSTIALKASGLFIAKSAKTLRFNSILLVLSFPINCEYDNP